MPHDPNSARHLYQIRVPAETRDKFRERLAELGVGTQVHYPPVHLQPYYRERFGYKEGDFSVAEDAASRILSLPLHPQMSESDVERVAEALTGILAAVSSA